MKKEGGKKMRKDGKKWKKGRRVREEWERKKGGKRVCQAISDVNC